MQQLPNGTWQGPLLGPVNLNIPGSTTVSRNRNQNVPGSAAPGVYIYRGYVGVYSNAKWDSSSFQYTKSATGGTGPGYDNWANWGDSFAPYEVLPVASVNQPVAYSLAQCRPNPFNPATTISYSLPQAGVVTLKVFDVSGRTVATLVDGFRAAGAHEVSFNGADLASGLYFYRLQSGDFTAVRKMMLIK
jgi:hypothetical protein